MVFLFLADNKTSLDRGGGESLLGDSDSDNVESVKDLVTTFARRFAPGLAGAIKLKALVFLGIVV